jgi:hypothetical protein
MARAGPVSKQGAASSAGKGEDPWQTPSQEKRENLKEKTLVTEMKSDADVLKNQMAMFRLESPPPNEVEVGTETTTIDLDEDSNLDIDTPNVLLGRVTPLASRIPPTFDAHTRQSPIMRDEM